jgi:hypothetical protein
VAEVIVAPVSSENGHGASDEQIVEVPVSAEA